MKTEFNLQLTAEITLKGYIYISSGEAKGIVIICHGMAEHIGRYDEFMNYLSNEGYIVVGYDQRGHGKTAGSIEACGYMDDEDNFEALVNDLYKVNSYIKEQYPNLPVFLLGHSMGSFVSQRYIELYGNTLNGLILSGSSFNQGLFITLGNLLAAIITKLKGRKYISNFINDLSLGSYNNKFEPAVTGVEWLSRDENNNLKYVEDEYCGMTFSVSYFKDLTKGFKTIKKNLELINNDLPIYIFSGDADPVGDFGKGTTLLYTKLKKIGVKDITLKLYKEGRHEMLNEINKHEVYENILEWLNKH